MSFLLARSISLSERTREAWKAQGGTFVRRDRTLEEIENLVRNNTRYQFFINLGISDLNVYTAPSLGQLPVYNHGAVVTSLIRSENARAIYSDIMAPQTGESEFVWEKKAGRGGKGKTRHATSEVSLDDLHYWEDEIVGQEYRVVTVGDKRIQQFLRHGSNGSRQYRWLPMSDLPDAIKRTTRIASERLPYRSVVAWDLVFGNPTVRQHEEEKAYLLEGNTCPGVSTDTALRVVNQIKRRENISD